MPVILTKKSDTPGSVPSTANLTNLAGGAELAVNTADKRLFTMNSSSAVVEVGTNPTTLSTASLTITTGNLGFTGTAQRITGDFSNATASNRVVFQSNITNGVTQLTAAPNGTGTQSGLFCFDNSDLANNAWAAIRVVASTDARIQSSITGTGSYLPLTFYTGGSERLRIDTSGRVLVNSTSARANLFNSTTSPNLQIEGTTADTSSVFAVRNTDTAAAGSFFILGRARGTTVGSTTVVQSGDTIGSLSFQGSDGTEFVEAARIIAFVDGTPGANDMPGGLTFNTTADGGTSSTERMRIDSSGNVGIGGTALAYTKCDISGTLPSSSNTTVSFNSRGTIPSTTTSDYNGFAVAGAATQAASFTLTNAVSYYTNGVSVGAGSTITNQYGFRAESGLTGATNNYGFYSNIASGTNRWNFYANGTAQNYFAGNTRTDGTLLAASAQTWDERLGAYRTENQVVIGGYANNGSYTSSVIRVQVERASSNAFYFLEARVSTGALRYGILGDGTVTTSDERRKKNITSVNDGLLSNLCKLRVVNYNWKTDLDADEKKIGLIAQEVEQVFPELVMVRYDGPNDDQEVKVLKTDSLVPMLIKAIQEQQTMIDELKAKVAALETK